jgi:S1-C subfamily serine protease
MEPSSIGLVVNDVNDELYVRGVVIHSQAHEAGFYGNDVITRINGVNVNSVADAAIAMSDLTYGDTAIFYVQRENRNIVIRIEIRNRRPTPRQLNITSVYETNTIKLGYGEDFIQIQAISSENELSEAGLVAGDVIVAVNGAAIADMNNLFAGESIDLTVERNNTAMNVNVPTTVAPLLMFGLDAPVSQEVGEWLGLHEKQVTLGVRYIQLESNSQYFGNSGVSNGAYVAEVIEGLPAAQAGIQVGDIIISVDGEVATMEIDLRNRIYAHKAGDDVTIEILRNGEIIEVDVTLRVATS